MTKVKGAALIMTSLFVLSGVLTPSQSEPGQRVAVINFPKSYDVKGEVSIQGTMSHTKFVKREGIVVTTSHRTEAAELISAGTLESDGFTHVTLGLLGEVKASAVANGIVGVMLVPDEEPVLRAFRESKQVAFPIEATCQLYKNGPSFYHADLVTQPLAFGRYQIYLYNTAPNAVEANVYIYLKN